MSGHRNQILDALRALAIMLVFLGHCVNSYGSPSWLAPLQFGGTGVDLFFVLSGWLIGNQLFSERDRFSNIEVVRFWLRRWMRTMPAYFAVLGLTITQLYITKDAFNFPWAHLFFLQNYIGESAVFFVSWSLSVEEQFYLFIAPFVVFITKRDKAFQAIALFVLLVSPSVFRSLGLYESLHETHVRLDCCAMGVSLAFIKHYYAGIWCTLSSNMKWLFPLSFTIYILFYINRYNPLFGFSDPNTLHLAILFGTWIVWADSTSVRIKPTYHAIIYFISTRSYSMYLLHVDALALTKRFLTTDVPFPVYYIVAIILTFVVSEVLYRCIEIPFMNARQLFRLSRPRGISSGLAKDGTHI